MDHNSSEHLAPFPAIYREKKLIHYFFLKEIKDLKSSFTFNNVFQRRIQELGKGTIQFERSIWLLKANQITFINFPSSGSTKDEAIAAAEFGFHCWRTEVTCNESVAFLMIFLLFYCYSCLRRIAIITTVVTRCDWSRRREEGKTRPCYRGWLPR